jgi:hypothetical protein
LPVLNQYQLTAADLTLKAASTVKVRQKFKLYYAGNITNKGPSAPVDVIMSTGIRSDRAFHVSPAPSIVNLPGVPLNGAKTYKDEFTLECNIPGTHQLVVDSKAGVKRANPELVSASGTSARVEITCTSKGPVKLDPRKKPQRKQLCLPKIVYTAPH